MDMNLTDSENLAWAAGLFEGEGCFSVQRQRHRNEYRYMRAVINMTDEDVLRRFCSIVGEGRVSGPHSKGRHKPQWTWTASGPAAVRVFEMFKPFLGKRRLEAGQKAFDGQKLGAPPGRRVYVRAS